MGKLDQHTAPPLPDLSIDGSDQECPECKHERGEPYYSPWRLLARKFGFTPPPRAESCDYEAVQGISDACGCSNPFHGS